MADKPNMTFKPTKAGLKLEHPLDGVMADEGGVWREDQFTLRRLRDGDIERIAAGSATAAPEGAETIQQPSDRFVADKTAKGA